MKFELSPSQQKRHDSWIKNIVMKIKSDRFGAIGGVLTYEFTPTGLGDVVRVYFLKGTTQEQYIDLTEYELW